MKQISVEHFKNILELANDTPSVAYINVCTEREYAEKHIQGVRNLPLNTLGLHIEELQGMQTIYVHCRSGKRAEQAIEFMLKSGITADMVNVIGGLQAWEEAGFSTGSKISSNMTLMRQVFLTAGIIIILGTLLTFISGNNSFLIIPGFVGLGLTISGLTGWCGLQMLLTQMPWNKVNTC